MPPLAIDTFAAAVDHTLLDAGSSGARIDALCDEAVEHRFASVCIYPWWVRRAVQQMRRELPDRVAIKASGGIRTADQARAMLEAGATRLGTSSALSILKELTADAVA